MCDRLSAREAVPEVWVTPTRWTDATDGAAFRADLRDTLSAGSVCLPEKTDGDLTASLPGDAEARLRALLRSR